MKIIKGDFRIPWLSRVWDSALSLGGSGSIPGRDKILQARQHGQRKRKKNEPLSWPSARADSQMVFPAGGISDLCSHSQNAHCPTCPVPSRITPSAPGLPKTKLSPPLPVYLLQAGPSAAATMDLRISGFLSQTSLMFPQSC